MVEAIGHALNADDNNFAAKLINQAAMAMVEHSDIVALLGWIARLPNDATNTYLPLRLAEAWALTLTLRPQARTLMDALAGQVDSLADPKKAAQLQLELSAIETIFLAVYEDRLDAAVAFGYDFLGRQDDEDSLATRAVRNATAYCETQRGNTHVVHDLVRPAQLRALKKEQLFTTAYRYSVVGINYVAQGELLEAERCFQTGLAVSEQLSGRQSASSGLLSAFVARSLYERGDLEAALSVLEGRLPIIDEAAFHEAVIDAYVVRIRIAALHGEMDRASAFVEHAELIGHERNWRRLLAYCALERTRLGLPLTTDLDRLNVYDTSKGLEKGPLNLNCRTNAIITKARCLSQIMAGNGVGAQASIQALAEHAQLTRNEPLQVKTKLLKIVSSAMHDHDYVLDPATCDLISRAVARGYGRTLLDGFVPLDEDRLRKLLSPVPGIGRLLDPHTQLIHAESGPVGIRANTLFSILTSREIDVLTGVGRGDSNKEVARRLHLTPETVKWHLKNVMRKLNADNRAQAVTNASFLGLSLTGDDS